MTILPLIWGGGGGKGEQRYLPTREMAGNCVSCVSGPQIEI
jgi:hypothetical protein